jgi:acyl carrier protein
MIEIKKLEKNEVLKTVHEYLMTEFEISSEKIHLEAHLFDDLDMDSIDALDWFAAMESQIGLPIVEAELKEVRTVQDVVDYVMRNLDSDIEKR